MKNFATKLTVIIAIFLMLSTIAMATDGTIGTATAQLATSQPVSGSVPTGVTPNETITIKAYLSFAPNPIGLNQSLLVNMWTTPALNPHRFHQGYKVTITAPDGTQEIKTLNSYCADATAWFEYTPTQVGTYQLKFEFPGEYYPAGQYYNGYIVTNTSGNYLASAYYTPCYTEEQNLTVQSNMVASWPPSALPTDYWTRPVHLENREWWSILGNYPGDGVVGGGSTWPDDTNTYMSNYGYTPYVQAPETSHIVWKRLGALSGLIGGSAGIYGVTNNPGTPSVIYMGRCYQTLTVPINGVPTSCAVCYDLRTGQQYYAIPVASGGVTPSYVSCKLSTAEAVPGGTGDDTYDVSLLSIGTRLIKIDPYTGAVTLNVTGITATSSMFYNDPYVMSFQTLGSGTSTKYCLVNWTTAGTETNFTNRIISNVTLAWTLPVFPNTAAMGGTSRVYDFEANVAVWSCGMVTSAAGALDGTWIRVADLTTGAELWNITVSDTRYSSASILADHGKLAILMQNGYWMVWNSRTGKLQYETELMTYPWGAASFGAYAAQSAYGLFYRESYDGIYAFNWTNGQIVWHFSAPSVSFETPYSGNTSFNSGGMIVDGKLYVANSEHTTTWPRTRGWKLFCLNATTGEEIWNITGAATPGAVLDGYLTASNADDGYMYVYGKGQTATTVSAPDLVVTQGTGVVIKGTVLDMSPAQEGTPCVSVESMTTQMEYLHMQLPIDGIWHNETLTGVTVKLTAIDSNGNSIDIGTVVTSGYYGTFSKAWTPPNEGDYQIIASFAGDDSYGSSSASTGISVSAAASTTPSPTPLAIASNPPYEMYTVGMGIAIIIAIAIVGLLILRKKA